MPYSDTEIELSNSTCDTQGFTIGIYQAYLKRFLDVIFVLFVLPGVIPLIMVLSLIVRRDGGPAFYSQSRVGRGGKIFRLWKFRSMVVDADARLEAHLAADPPARAEWEEHQKLKDDPRITSVGRIIRKASLDELPQLWNVLLGDMSIVGPRPILPDQAPLYHGKAYFHLRPGMTGLWQVSVRNEASFAERAVYDTKYAYRLSFLTDLRILFATVRVVFSGTGC